MWNRNLDTGKWFQQIDTLSKENYEDLKVDLEKVKLYSKCLSGATYLTISDFDNLYPELAFTKTGFYFDTAPSNGPLIRITKDNQDEFYNKYLAEYAFTIKNLFTPDKLIKSEGQNFITVDVATTGNFDFKTGVLIIIDGITLIKGHKILVKDQKKQKILSSSVNEVTYFTDTFPVATYTLVDDNITSLTYEYFTEENGIYEYDGNSFTKLDYLSTYTKSRKLLVAVKMGEINGDKQFNLARLKNGYFPVEGENVEFQEKINWVLRNRVDYNNVYDLNFYDVIQHGPQSIYDVELSKTYSIPSRVIAVGEFGAIINNQDTYSPSATYSISNIISNKYKVNLRSIVEVDNYYWVCGDEGVLLKVSKIDYTIEKIDLEEDLNFTSVSFVDNLYGVVVGKFNTIYYTRDAGKTWVQIQYNEFEKYSYTSVLHVASNNFLLAGENGIFIEFTFSAGNWSAYKRNITKSLGIYDEYNLVDDINDLDLVDWVNIKPSTFNAGLTLSTNLLNGYDIFQISTDGAYVDSETFSNIATIYMSFSYSNVDGNFYTNTNYGNENEQNYLSYDIYAVNDVDAGTTTDKTSCTFSLPVGDDGNIKHGNYTLDIHLLTNYDPTTDNIVVTYSQYYRQDFLSEKGNLILIGGNNQSVIAYDLLRIISPTTNPFLFATFTQSVITDVKSIERRKDTPDVYITSDKIYKFNMGSFNIFSDRTKNETLGYIEVEQDIFANKIATTTQSIYLAGNNSVLKKYEIGVDTSFNDLDPTFNDRIKSRFLILDYDIGSKLNFFDDDGNYRVPDPVSFDSTDFVITGTTFSINSLSGEMSWIDYYKDADKSFKLGSSFDDSNVVKYSSQFCYTPNANTYRILPNKIGIAGTNRATKFDIFKTEVLGVNYTIIPNIEDPTLSEYRNHGEVPPAFSTPYDLFLHKNIAVFKVTIPTRTQQDIDKIEKFKVGDVLYLQSDVVDAKLMINRIEYYVLTDGQINGVQPATKVDGYPSGFGGIATLHAYLYTISNFNENIINNLTRTTGQINFVNLNNYSTVEQLIERLDNHPIGVGYKLTEVDGSVEVNTLFNEKTAYYNLQSQIMLGESISEIKYKESFLDFGFSPTYNIFSYLNKINPDIFPFNKEFAILPSLNSLPGNNGNSFTSSNVWIDSGLSSASQSNVLMFGSNYQLEWESLLPNTFVNLIATTNTGLNRVFNQTMITRKYYVPNLLDSGIEAWAVEFDRKLTIDQPISFFTIYSRRKLFEISGDLQLLNNIQRSQTTKSLQPVTSFTNLENPIRTKFSTDSYLKVLTSDYDVQENISAILYTDEEFQISMNILNLEKILEFNFRGPQSVEISPGVYKLGFSLDGSQGKLTKGDLIYLEFDDDILTPMEGLQTVLSSNFGFVITTMDFDFSVLLSEGTITYIKKDPFFNYQPVDIFRHGSDSKVTRSVEVLPTNYVLSGTTFSLVDLDLQKFKIELLDGLSLDELSQKYHWILEAEVSNALIGQNQDGLVWYSGKWRCGRWFGGTWMSGEWLSGDWYKGTWNAFSVLNKIISAKVDTSFSDQAQSKWYNGRWFEGTWNNGIWYNGRRYAGDWNSGTWFNGVWNDGTWNNGFFYGGIWVLGTWNKGIFNCESKPAYWLDGTFVSGDFENGIWYNGLFGNDQSIPSRFGTKASNTRTATWHSGKWINGEFHSGLSLDEDGIPTVSDIHKYSIWRTGLWNKGDWYGGIAFNIDFRGGIWHGGILEEIQVVGLDATLPAQTSNNRIYVKGIFKFNVGDEIWIIDDLRNSGFSKLGSNEIPTKYRINQIIEDPITETTGLYLNYNLSSLGLNTTTDILPDQEGDIQVRVVSIFSDVTWKSGLWTNGIFTGGQFDSGIWYNGVFDGTWGN